MQYTHTGAVLQRLLGVCYIAAYLSQTCGYTPVNVYTVYSTNSHTKIRQDREEWWVNHSHPERTIVYNSVA